MGYMRDYVRDYGGGLVMIGGEESFGLGGYYRAPVEEALPVTMEVKQKVEIPSLAVVLSIDRSGSMAMSTDEKVTKLDLAKEAAHLVVDLLDERNERSEEHTSELQSLAYLVCRLLLEKKTCISWALERCARGT